MSLFLVGMDSTVINVALPSVGRDFHAPVSGLQWTADAYLLVVASLLMLSGSVGDRVGRRTVCAMGPCVLALAVATAGRTGRASATRAAAIIERADRAAPDHAVRAA